MLKRKLPPKTTTIKVRVRDGYFEEQMLEHLRKKHGPNAKLRGYNAKS